MNDQMVTDLVVYYLDLKDQMVDLEYKQEYLLNELDNVKQKLSKMKLSKKDKKLIK